MTPGKIFIIVLAGTFIIFGLFGATPTKAVSMSLPATGNGASTDAGSTPGGFINSFYQFALFLSGIVAFGAIVFGGVKYMTSAGNPSGQSEGKEWIYSALLGVALLAGAYLILNTVNPQITNLSLPGLPQLQTNNASVPTGCGGGSVCPAGTTCSSFGSCVASNGQVYCGGSTNALCADPSQVCENNGDTLNPNYSCRSLVAGACSGIHYSSSGCAPPLFCVNNGTNQQPNYQCATH